MFHKLALGLMLLLGGCTLSDMEYMDIGIKTVGKAEHAPDIKIEVKQ